MSFILNFLERSILILLILAIDVFSSNHQVIDIYYDEYFSSGVASDEQSVKNAADVHNRLNQTSDRMIESRGGN